MKYFRLDDRYLRIFHVIIGWHDAQLADVDDDRDIDIVSKIWNKDGLVYHLDYRRINLIEDKEPNKYNKLILWDLLMKKK